MNPDQISPLIYFMIGCFALNSLYHYCLFLFYKKNLPALYFAFINTVALAFNLLHLFSTAYDQKIGSLIFVLNPLFFLLFLNSLFPEEFRKSINKIYYVVSTLLFVIIFAFPNSVYINVFMYFNKVVMLLMLFDIAYILQALIRAVIKRREDAPAIMTGMAVMALLSISRYLFRDSFVRIPNPVGALFLMFFYSLTLAKRFSDSYYKREELIQQKTAALNSMNARLKELAIRDPLTNLYNRRYFFEYADHIFDQFERSGTGFSLVIFDIDHFKRINDSYGHLTGDHVLKSLAKLMDETLRKADISARFGGEEFVLLFCDTGLSDAVKVVEKIRKRIAGMEFSAEDERSFAITASFGIASSHPNKKDFLSIVHDADTALYHSKANGRNCTSFTDWDGQLNWTES